VKRHVLVRLRVLPAVVVAAGVLAGPLLACGDGWMAHNLVLTPRDKAGLRAAYLRAHPGLVPSRVGQPVSGSTYFGSYSGTLYAVATFAAGPGAGYPTIFRTGQNGRWHVRKQTRGGICSDVVPIELIKAWWLEHRSGRCFEVPASRA
jgi:hypothetical protein